MPAQLQQIVGSIDKQRNVSTVTFVGIWMEKDEQSLECMTGKNTTLWGGLFVCFFSMSTL